MDEHSLLLSLFDPAETFLSQNVRIHDTVKGIRIDNVLQVTGPVPVLVPILVPFRALRRKKIGYELVLL